MFSLKLFYYKTFVKTVFVIVVKKSKIEYVNGIKHKRFIHDCEDVIRENGVFNGIIYGVKNIDGITQLKTTDEISISVAQRLRNVWSFYS